MLDRARESMNRALIALDSAATKVMAAIEAAPEYPDKLGSHLAWITRQVAEVTNALRQLEKHDRVMSRTPAQRFALVRGYIEAEATPPQRADLLQLLTELDTGRSVLS
jgi:superfamily II RNA helicase